MKVLWLDPANSIRFVKRLMGDDLTLTFYGNEYTPQAISAPILEETQSRR